MCTHTYTCTHTHVHVHTHHTILMHAHTHTQTRIIPCSYTITRACISYYTPAVLQPTTDPTVRTEVTHSQTHRVPSHPSPTQMACTSAPPTSQMCTPRIPSSTLTPAAGQPEQGSPSTIFSPVFQAYQPVVMQAGCVQTLPPQSVHDSEPEPTSSAGLPALHT